MNKFILRSKYKRSCNVKNPNRIQKNLLKLELWLKKIKYIQQVYISVYLVIDIKEKVKKTNLFYKSIMYNIKQVIDNKRNQIKLETQM